MSLNLDEPIIDHKDAEYNHPRVNEISQKFLTDLDEERVRLGDNFPLIQLLIDEAIERTITTGRIPGREFYADVYKQKPIKVIQKVFVPVKQFPKFNFSGKILGPKGNSLRRLQEDTQCKIVIKGRNSMRDRNKEEELRNSGDPRSAHLHKDLYIEISTVATPAEAYARIAYALAEIRKYLIPDKNDEVSQEQLRELMEIDPVSAKNLSGMNPEVFRSVFDNKALGGRSAPKYLSLIKRTSYNDHESEEYDDKANEYQPSNIKRTTAATNDYFKARPVSTSLYKRTQPTMYPAETKRLRETPAKPYQPNSYLVLRKYK